MFFSRSAPIGTRGNSNIISNQNNSEKGSRGNKKKILPFPCDIAQKYFFFSNYVTIFSIKKLGLLFLNIQDKKKKKT